MRSPEPDGLYATPNTPRVYIASHFAARDEVVKLRMSFHDRGLVVTSSWIDEQFDANELPDEEQGRTAARRLAEIEWAHVLIAYHPTFSRMEYCASAELGYAVAMFKPIVVVGYRPSIYHRLPQVLHLASVDVDVLTDAIIGMMRHFEARKARFRRRRTKS